MTPTHFYFGLREGHAVSSETALLFSSRSWSFRFGDNFLHAHAGPRQRLDFHIAERFTLWCEGERDTTNPIVVGKRIFWHVHLIWGVHTKGATAFKANLTN